MIFSLTARYSGTLETSTSPLIMLASLVLPFWFSLSARLFFRSAALVLRHQSTNISNCFYRVKTGACQRSRTMPSIRVDAKFQDHCKGTKLYNRQSQHQAGISDQINAMDIFETGLHLFLSPVEYIGSLATLSHISAIPAARGTILSTNR